jgi:hypothetical protein
MFLGIVLCESFIRKDTFRVGNMIFESGVYLRLFYAEHQNKKPSFHILCAGDDIPFRSAGPGQSFPARILFPLALLTIYQYRKKQKSQLLQKKHLYCVSNISRKQIV